MTQDKILRTLQRFAFEQAEEFTSGGEVLPSELCYLPTTYAELSRFVPHNWVTRAAAHMMHIGSEEMSDKYDPKIAQLTVENESLRKQISQHEHTIEKFKLVEAIRQEATSFSVNTKDLLDLVDDLASMVK